MQCSRWSCQGITRLSSSSWPPGLAGHLGVVGRGSHPGMEEVSCEKRQGGHQEGGSRLGDMSRAQEPRWRAGKPREQSDRRAAEGYSPVVQLCPSPWPSPGTRQPPAHLSQKLRASLTPHRMFSNSALDTAVSGEGNGTPLQYSCLEKPHGQRSLVGCRPHSPHTTCSRIQL